MPTIIDLGKLVKQKYPGSYDDIPDEELGKKVKAKYPEYSDFSDTTSTTPTISNKSLTPIDTTPTKSSTGLTAGPLSLLAVPGQLIAKTIGQQILKKPQSKIAQNIQEMRNTFDKALKAASETTDPNKKASLIAVARQTANEMAKSGASITELQNEIAKRQEVKTPIGTIPALSNNAGEVAKQVSGRGLQTLAVAAPVNPAASGFLFGAGSALEENKPIVKKPKINPEDNLLKRGATAFNALNDSIIGRGLIYAGAGKALQTATTPILNAVGKTQLAQRALTSPVGKKVLDLTGKVVDATTVKKAAPGTLSAGVDEAFNAFATGIDKFVSPSTYTRAAGKVLRPAGEAVGVLRTQQQKVENAQNKITEYWNKNKSRYKNLVVNDTNSPEILGKEGIVPTLEHGSLSTIKQQEALLAKANGERLVMNNLLKEANAYTSLSQVESSAIDNLSSVFKGVDRDEAIKYLQRELDALVNQNKALIIEGTNGQKLIPVDLLNEWKSYLWSKGYPSKITSPSEKVTLEAARSIGNAFKTNIENSLGNIDPVLKDTIIKMNNRLGELYNAARFLDAINGSKPAHGIIAQHFARTIGAFIGSSAGAPGAITGAITASKLVDIFRDPKFSVGGAANIIALAEKEAPEELQKAYAIMRQIQQQRASRLQLPAPSKKSLNPTP